MSESIVDIVREMRVYVDECNKGVTAHTRYGNGAFPLDDLADRIEAAYNREKENLAVGNGAKVRDALSDACYAMFNFLKTKYGGYEEMANALDKAKAALAEPPRNCDLYEKEDDAFQAHRYALEDNPEETSIYYEEWLFQKAKGGVK